MANKRRHTKFRGDRSNGCQHDDCLPFWISTNLKFLKADRATSINVSHPTKFNGDRSNHC